MAAGADPAGVTVTLSGNGVTGPVPRAALAPAWAALGLAVVASPAGEPAVTRASRRVARALVVTQGVAGVAAVARVTHTLRCGEVLRTVVTPAKQQGQMS